MAPPCCAVTEGYLSATAPTGQTSLFFFPGTCLLNYFLRSYFRDRHPRQVSGFLSICVIDFSGVDAVLCNRSGERAVIFERSCRLTSAFFQTVCNPELFPTRTPNARPLHRQRPRTHSLRQPPSLYGRGSILRHLRHPQPWQPPATITRRDR